MATERQTLARWGLACGGPIAGSLAITGLLAVGIPALLGGASPRPGGAEMPPETTQLEVTALRAAVAPVSRDEGGPRLATRPHRPATPPRPPVAQISAAEPGPVVETGDWPDEERERLADLQRQQTHFGKTIVDMTYAARGIDTSMLTFEEISGGRHLRGGTKSLARQAAQAAGGGGAPGDTAAAEDAAEPPAEIAPSPVPESPNGSDPSSGDDAPSDGEVNDEEAETAESGKDPDSTPRAAQGGQGSGPEATVPTGEE